MNLDNGAPFIDPGATAMDACEGDLTGSIFATGAVNVSVPGNYIRTYTVSDSGGKTASTNRSVVVRSKPLISATSAFISGTNAITGLPVLQFLAAVNPNGLASTAHFQYGLSTAYPGRTTTINLPASYNVSSFLGLSDGLMPGATYHYRAAASNSLGVSYSSDQTFAVPASALGDLNRDGRVDSSELGVVQSNYWVTSSPLVMTSPRVLGGVFQFGLTNEAGWDFTMLATTNLNTPLALWTNIGPAVPVWQFHDAAASNQPQRFYRLRSP